MSAARSRRPSPPPARPAYFVHPGEASHGDLGMITPDDVIMAISWSGETAELKDLTDYSRRFRIGLIAITAKADSALAQAADVVLVLPQAREACPHNLAPTTSTLMQQALGDALAIALLGKPRLHRAEIRRAASGRPARRDAEIRARRHAQRRRRSAGRRLGTRMSDALVVMSAKSLGCVVIVDADGRLAGIITDGDLRRHMSANLLDLHGRGDHDTRAQDGAAGPARQRGAGNPQRLAEDRS